MADTLAQLKELLGPDGWLLPEDGVHFLQDILGTETTCLLIARPSTTEQVSDLVRIWCGSARRMGSRLCRKGAIPTSAVWRFR
jgi:hypothetical protein